jgi:hypothetical protein
MTPSASSPSTTAHASSTTSSSSKSTQTTTQPLSISQTDPPNPNSGSLSLSFDLPYQNTLPSKPVSARKQTPKAFPSIISPRYPPNDRIQPRQSRNTSPFSLHNHIVDHHPLLCRHPARGRRFRRTMNRHDPHPVAIPLFGRLPPRRWRWKVMWWLLHRKLRNFNDLERYRLIACRLVCLWGSRGGRNRRLEGGKECLEGAVCRLMMI